MEIKIEGKLNSSATEALADHAKALYDKPSTRVGIVELRSDYNVAPNPGSEKKAAVVCRINLLEIATADQEEDVRRAMQALYLHRTARGTLDDAGQLEFSEDTVRLLGSMLHERETVRLSAGLRHWAREMDRIANSSILTPGEFRHEFDRVHDGLNALLHPARVPDDE